MSKREQEGSVNPFCAAFPKVVSCDVPTVGASGREQWHNGLCVLSQNVINEKIYLGLWFYLVFVMMCCLAFVLYRVATLFFDPFRFYIIYGRIGHRYDPEIRSSLRYVLNRCYLGDWFVLQQLCRNVNIYFYREFIKELKQEMKGRPKKAMRDMNMTMTEEMKESRRAISAETRMEGASEPNPEPEPEAPKKSQYLLRIEHEQRLMPGMRGRRGRGRGRGRGGRGGRGKRRK